jgi:hypothetical protein
MPIEKVATGLAVVPAPEPEQKPEAEDPRYFKLSKPIKVGNQTFEKLLVDSSELSGTVYFQLVGRFRKEYPDIYRTSINKLGEEVFLSYVVAALNPPMTAEDIPKLSFKDLPILFMAVQSFVYGARTAESATEE